MLLCSSSSFLQKTDSKQKRERAVNGCGAVAVGLFCEEWESVTVKKKKKKMKKKKKKDLQKS